MTSERRRSARVSTELEARWLRRPWPRPARVLDVSQHGLLLETDEPYPLNHVMDIEVALPDGTVSMLVTSRFVGVCGRGHGIGTSLFAVAPEDLVRWVMFHQRLASATARG